MYLDAHRTIPEKHSLPTHFRKNMASAFKQDPKWYKVEGPLHIQTTEEDRGALIGAELGNIMRKGSSHRGAPIRNKSKLICRTVIARALIKYVILHDLRKSH